ncbi:predicted protein [Histoplasma capsulatum G186AR]|uniref:DUF7924 domain-containing protein n=1 Tax=Ajellomyces capsulatus (strain G186AR / H82 / ATCC MYA-2454 / RMSCC 2432) TaxID=447093 RepID=C0NIS6_AJECG|nr:uncharacterized protein HCBG_02333 [Histoplasma capsulatum G186AR]EEH08796.1 predicted protein [Histoplasma capsulatum G186AR]
MHTSSLDRQTRHRLQREANPSSISESVDLTRPGGFTVGEVKRTTSIDVGAPRVVQTVGPEHSVESVNESWDSSISLGGTIIPNFTVIASSEASTVSNNFDYISRPPPDYAVGLPRQSFTEDQLKKLAPFVGEIGDMSFFMGAAYMYFPFLK